MSGLGPDPSEEPRGSTLQDLYDFLMTPRHRRERSISPGGRFTHYGPSRRAGVSGEDQAAAKLIMQQMKEDEEHKIAMDRLKKSDTLMTGRGIEAGGTMSVPGKDPMMIAPKPAMTSADRMTAQAGGIPTDPILEQSVRASARGNMTATGKAQWDKFAMGQEEKASTLAAKVMTEVVQFWPELETEFKGNNWDAIVQKFIDSEVSDLAKTRLGPHITQYLEYLARAREGRLKGQAFDIFTGSEIQDANEYAVGGDGQINPARRQ